MLATYLRVLTTMHTLVNDVPETRMTICNFPQEKLWTHVVQKHGIIKHLLHRNTRFWGDKEMCFH